MFKLLATLPLAALALAAPALAQAPAAPALAPLGEAEMRSLPPEYRSAPAASTVTEKIEVIDGVETITRTRRIDLPAPAAPQAAMPQGYPYPYGAAYVAAWPVAYPPAPVVFEREQWLAECRRRTAGKSKDETGTIIGALLGGLVGGAAGYEIAGAGDRVLGTALGIGGGGLIGGLIGSRFNRRKTDQYDCEAALDAYLSQPGPPMRIASREIASPAPAYPAPAYAAPAYFYPYAYAYPAYGYGYPPLAEMVLVPVRSQVPQQVVVRETVREESYPAPTPGAARSIPASRPSAKMIKPGR
jgi:hypothetical protein